MKEEKEGSRQREQHMQRPRGWFRGELQNIQEGKEEAGTLTAAEVGTAVGARQRRQEDAV